MYQRYATGTWGLTDGITRLVNWTIYHERPAGVKACEPFPKGATRLLYHSFENVKVKK